MRQVDAEMLQDLILSAVNLALEQSRALAAERLGPLCRRNALLSGGHRSARAVGTSETRPRTVLAS